MDLCALPFLFWSFLLFLQIFGLVVTRLIQSELPPVNAFWLAHFSKSVPELRPATRKSTVHYSCITTWYLYRLVSQSVSLEVGSMPVKDAQGNQCPDAIKSECSTSVDLFRSNFPLLLLSAVAEWASSPAFCFHTSSYSWSFTMDKPSRARGSVLASHAKDPSSIPCCRRWIFGRWLD